MVGWGVSWRWQAVFSRVGTACVIGGRVDKWADVTAQSGDSQLLRATRANYKRARGWDSAEADQAGVSLWERGHVYYVSLCFCALVKGPSIFTRAAGSLSSLHKKNRNIMTAPEPLRSRRPLNH